MCMEIKCFICVKTSSHSSIHSNYTLFLGVCRWKGALRRFGDEFVEYGEHTVQLYNSFLCGGSLQLNDGDIIVCFFFNACFTQSANVKFCIFKLMLYYYIQLNATISWLLCSLSSIDITIIQYMYTSNIYPISTMVILFIIILQ